ncbi:MAG: hypothetical protein WD472_11390 [Dehalococcoidia bacterium]
MRFLSPNGTAIIGTLERLSGRAEAEEYEANGEPCYSGSTEIFYDDQETVWLKGSRVYLDESGQEWLFSELTPEESVAPLPRATAPLLTTASSPMQRTG